LRAEERVKAIFDVIGSVRQDAVAALAPLAEEGAAGVEQAGSGSAPEAPAGDDAPSAGGDQAAPASGAGQPSAGAGEPPAPASVPVPALPVDELVARAEEQLSQQGITLDPEVLAYGLQLDDETRAAVQERTVRIAADLMSRRRIGVDDLERERE